MTTVEIPYKPKGTPEIEFVEHNGANLKLSPGKSRNRSLTRVK